MIKKSLIVFSFVFISCNSKAAIIDCRLEIQSGLLTLADGSLIDFKTFSQAPSFSASSDILIWQIGDIINLRVVNSDTMDHGFILDSYADYGTIASGDSVEQTLTLISSGVFRYYDPSNGAYNQYLGLAGIVHIKEVTDNFSYFYWDLREHDTLWNQDLALGNSPDPLYYHPAYFTINSQSSPLINADVMARVTGTVGTEFRIVMMNNGLSIHSLHFHGYHLFLEASSNTHLPLGCEKDTYPIYPKEHMLVSCVPDKPGEYPVHDHNLVAVTGGGYYGTGMFTTMLIAP